MFVTPAYAEEAAPAAGETHSETGTPSAHAGFPPFNPQWFPSQLLWLVVSFVVFYIVMQKVVIPRVGGILENRHTRIAQDVEEAARLKAEADAAVETYESELAAARAKANAIGTTARENAKMNAEQDRKAIEAELAEKLKAAEARIADVKEKAFAEVGTIAEDTASAVVEHLVGGAAGKAEIAKAVAEATAKQEG